MICTMVYQLIKDASIKELEDNGLGGYFSEHGYDLYPVNSDGVPFSVNAFSAVGDPVANLSENMAAEEKARAVYENLIDLADDPEVIGPLLFLRQREIIHFARFKKLYEEYKKKGYK